MPPISKRQVQAGAAQMLGFLKSLFAPRAPGGQDAHRLYDAVVVQARRSDFFTDLAVSDTVTGRFALVALHAFLVMDRLGQVASQAKVSQALFDVMFADMDRNLREMGVGDLSIGRRVKDLARHFYAMAAAYRDGLNRGDPVLRDAMCEYLYGGKVPAENVLSVMSTYLRACVSELAGQADYDIAVGRITFPVPLRAARR